jgi:hypothetical protein
LSVEKTNSANGFDSSRMMLIASSTPLTYTITTRDHMARRIFSKCREDPNLEPENKVPTLYSHNHVSKNLWVQVELSRYLRLKEIGR